MASRRVTEILAGLVTDGPAGVGLAERLVRGCADAVPVTGVGIVLMTDATPSGVVAVSDAHAGVLEELQFDLGEGPCVDACRTGRPVLVPDLVASGPARWPGFSAGALEAGVLAVFALPLQLGAIRLGVLDLYRDATGVLGPADLACALSYADAATIVLLHLQAQRRGDVEPGIAGAVQVLDDRAEVHQATGVLSVHAAVPLGDALMLLRARAYASGMPISQVARLVLDGSLDLAGSPPAGAAGPRHGDER